MADRGSEEKGARSIYNYVSDRKKIVDGKEVKGVDVFVGDVDQKKLSSLIGQGRLKVRAGKIFKKTVADAKVEAKKKGLKGEEKENFIRLAKNKAVKKLLMGYSFSQMGDK